MNTMSIYKILFSGCINGTYGEYCTSFCAHCGNNATCDKISGRCPDECEVGYYGQNCDEACGNCDGEINCNRQTGKCLKGCAASYHGEKCDKSKYISLLTITFKLLNVPIHSFTTNQSHQWVFVK